MAGAGLILLVTALALAPQIVRLRRMRRRAQLEQPQWAAEWKRTSRSDRRRITSALRRGETLYDPREARLLVGLSRRADMYQDAGGRRWVVILALTCPVVVFGIATGNAGLAVEAGVALGILLLVRGVLLPRQQDRRHRAAAANRELHGSP